MKTNRIPISIAILLITLSFSSFSGADESPAQGVENSEIQNEPVKMQEKGPVYSPLKVKPYTKRTYRA